MAALWLKSLASFKWFKLPGSLARPRGNPMKTRDLGMLLFGLAGLNTLLLAVLGLAQLLPELQRSLPQGQIQAVSVSSAVSIVLHLVFGLVLLGGRRALADRLLAGADGNSGNGGNGGKDGTGAGAGTSRATAGGGLHPQAIGFAALGVCALAILLLARFVTAASFGTLMLLNHDSNGDFLGWTGAGVALDVLLTALGVWLVVKRLRVAAYLLGARPPVPEADRSRAGAVPDTGWQLPALRFLGLTLVVWHLPALASAVATFIKWWLRPVGFDLRYQAIGNLPPAVVGIGAGLYFLLLPGGFLGGLWRRPPAPTPPASALSPTPPAPIDAGR
jgi:hypothetical protein